MRFNLARSLQQATMNITIKSLLTDAASVGLGIVLMLLLTNDNPIVVGIGICISVGLGIIAWRGLKVMVKYRLLPKKVISPQAVQCFSRLKVQTNPIKTLASDNFTTDHQFKKKSGNNSHLSLCFYSSGQNLKSALGHINLINESQTVKNNLAQSHPKCLDEISVSCYQKIPLNVNASSRIYNVKRRGN